MAHRLELYWDFSSPFSYFACSQAEALARRTGSELHYRPMLLGAVFKAVGTNNVPLLSFPEAKRRYALLDIQRWADHWSLPFKFPSQFPLNSLKPLRAYLALPEARRAAFRDAAYRAYWAEGQDIGEESVLRDLLGEGAEEILSLSRTPAIKNALFEATQRAINAGVFGAPTWIVDGNDLYWGQDRMVLVEEALTAPT